MNDDEYPQRDRWARFRFAIVGPLLAAPPAGPLAPSHKTWKAGRRLFRVHSSQHDANRSNPGFGRGRFHPIFTPRGKPIPTLYASNRIDGALSETVMHFKVGGDAIYPVELEHQMLSRLLLRRNLRLIDLTGLGIRRLEITRAQLIETDEAHYEQTARWAEALHWTRPQAHGLVWTSRQFDTAQAILLFGDRVTPSALEDLGSSEPLARGPGLRRVQKAAMLADIMVAV